MMKQRKGLDTRSTWLLCTCILSGVTKAVWKMWGFLALWTRRSGRGGVGGGIGKHERVIVSTLGEKKERRRKVLEVQKK